MVVRCILLDLFLVYHIVYCHAPTLFRHENILSKYSEMLYPSANIHRSWQEKAVSIVPLQIMTFFVVGQELFVVEPEKLGIGFDLLLGFSELESLLLELLKYGLAIC